MITLDYEKLVAAIHSEILKSANDRNAAAENGHFDTAARLNAQKDGLEKALRMIQSGDYHC